MPPRRPLGSTTGRNSGSWMVPRAVGRAISSLRADATPSVTTVRRRPGFHTGRAAGMEGLACAINLVTSIWTLKQLDRPYGCPHLAHTEPGNDRFIERDDLAVQDMHIASGSA